jgi:hypothetical protein
MKKRKRNFSSFDLAEAFKELGLVKLIEWNLEIKPISPGDFYHERIRRLKDHFDVATSERAKELLIDAICDEALLNHSQLKMWKAAPIQSENLTGIADYVAAPKRRYLDNPLLCVVEAKKDDFEQGLAQCLVEMKACQESNEQAGNKIDSYGIVTNGDAWQFYKLSLEGQVYESRLYVIGEIEDVLGCLHYVFTQCASNIVAFTKAA